ncbi:MAG: FG-GAP-like repeat-containing protein [Bacteroidetes bacterium]|nr:FG-GAP-like repeat-containing protein [Bacteroidota bacterium]
MGDIDGDGKKDIVISYGFTSSTISIYRNTSSSGSVSFSPKTDFATGLNPKFIAIGDLDGDGKNDICVTNRGERYFSIFKNNGSPGVVSLQARTDIVYPTNMFNKSVDMGDVDGDGKLDVIVGVDFTAPGTLIYKNISTVGNITLALGAQLDSGNPWVTTFADMDGDKKPDIIDVIPDWHFIRIYKNKTNEPGISMFSPTSGTIGTTITLSGVNFTGATAVSFGGVSASSFTVANSTTITAVVANGASGIINVETPFGTATINGFTFYLLPPSISSFTPNTARAGALVTITGTNFNGTNTVRFGGTDAASFLVVDNNTIQAIVGSGASGAVQVSHAGGSASMPGFGFVTGPIQIYTLRMCPQGNVFLSSLQTGSNYQWQVDEGSGFTNISDNSNYNGTSSSMMQIISPTSSWYGNMYRCLITTPSGQVLSPIYTLKFETIWTGSNDSDWFSPLNWGCGVLPNENTDVIIPGNLSNYPVINVPVTCRSLYLHPNANISVGMGVNVTIKGQNP